MNKRIKVGDFYLELPTETLTKVEPHPDLKPSNITLPEIPGFEPPKEPQHIYRPNDPFQAPIDEARAISSISSSHKPWVRKTWFCLFVIGPLVYAELAVLAMSVNGGLGKSWKIFLIDNMAVLPVWLIYYGIWRRKMKT